MLALLSRCWSLDAIGAGQASMIGDKRLERHLARIRKLANVKDEIMRLKEIRIAELGCAPPVIEQEYATPLMFQIKMIMNRTNLAHQTTAPHAHCHRYLFLQPGRLPFKLTRPRLCHLPSHSSPCSSPSSSGANVCNPEDDLLQGTIFKDVFAIRLCPLHGRCRNTLQHLLCSSFLCLFSVTLGQAVAASTPSSPF